MDGPDPAGRTTDDVLSAWTASHARSRRAEHGGYRKVVGETVHRDISEMRLLHT